MLVTREKAAQMAYAAERDSSQNTAAMPRVLRQRIPRRNARASQGHWRRSLKSGGVVSEVRQNRLLLPAGDAVPDAINAIVEIPGGSRNKYEYNKELDIFAFDRALHSATFYPGEYGFVPRTLALDGDPLDVLVLISEPTFSGCLISVRPIGILGMIDGGEPDDKVLAVPVSDPEYREVNEYTQISPHVLRKIQNFFATYKILEGKETQVGDWRDAAAAKRAVVESIERFKATSNPVAPH